MVKIKQHSICIIQQVLRSIKKLGTEAKEKIKGDNRGPVGKTQFSGSIF